mgnify:CR=1 FL=1
MNTRERIHTAFRFGVLTTLLLALLAAIAQESVPIPGTLQPTVRIAEPQKDSGIISVGSHSERFDTVAPHPAK